MLVCDSRDLNSLPLPHSSGAVESHRSNLPLQGSHGDGEGAEIPVFQIFLESQLQYYKCAFLYVA